MAQIQTLIGPVTLEELLAMKIYAYLTNTYPKWHVYKHEVPEITAQNGYPVGGLPLETEMRAVVKELEPVDGVKQFGSFYQMHAKNLVFRTNSDKHHENIAYGPFQHVVFYDRISRRLIGYVSASSEITLLNGDTFSTDFENGAIFEMEE